MHDTLLSITLLSITEQVLANNLGPVLLKSIGPGLKQTVTFQENLELWSARIATKVVNNHLVA